MNSTILESIGIDPAYFIIGLLGVSVILFILMMVAMVKLHNMKKKYKQFMNGKKGQSLEQIILQKFAEIDRLHEYNEESRKEIDKINENMLLTLKKIGIVKYDAFHEMGGKLSFSIALLNEKNDGFVLNAMHSREGCYTYVKEVIKGESYIALGEEEKQALDQAINFSNYMQ